MTRYKNFYDTAKFYKDKSALVHISLKSGVWFNGSIKVLEIDRLVLDEEKFGEMLILFERIKEDGIEPREKKR